MKYMLIAVIAVTSLTSCCHRHKRHHQMQAQGDAMSFEETKLWKTQYLTKKQELIKQELACIDVATDKPGLQKCTDDVFAKGIDMKDFNKQKK